MTKEQKQQSQAAQGFMDVTEAAEYIRHSVSYIHNNIDTIPHYKAGKLLFSTHDLDFWICSKGRNLMDITHLIIDDD